MGGLYGAQGPLFTKMRRIAVALALAGAAVAGAIVLASKGSPAASGLSWTAPASVAACGPALEPRVVFPYSAPNVRSGAGAIVWLARCDGRTIDAAVLGGNDQPSAAGPLTRGAAAHVELSAPLATAGTTRGQIVAVAGAHGEAMLGDGFARAGIDKLRVLRGDGSPVATQVGFIGDVDVATVRRRGAGYAIVLLAQRHFQHRFGRPLRLAAGPARPSALVLAMDFRADRLVIWDAAGELYARYVTNDGRVARRQKLGPAGYAPQVSAVLSDDDRAFVLWSDEPPPGVAGTARVLLAHSAFGPRFHGARTLSLLREPPDLRLTAGAVAAERLSSEGVALLWPAMSGSGDLVLDAAGATTGGVQPPSVVSLPGQDVRLGAVATGPDDEVVALVEVAPRRATGFDFSRQAIYAIRSNVVRQPDGLGFGALGELAAPGPNSAPSVAVDPDSDRAVAVWQTLVSRKPGIEWSVGARS